MILNSEEAKKVIYNDSEDWEEVETSIVDKTRWSVIINGIYRHIPSNKFYNVSFSKGATEYQEDEEPFYEKDVNFIEVELKEVKVLQWIKKE